MTGLTETGVGATQREITPTAIERFEAAVLLGSTAVTLKTQAAVLERQAAILGAEPYETPPGHGLYVTFFDTDRGGYERPVDVDVWDPGQAPGEEGRWDVFSPDYNRRAQTSTDLFREGHSDTRPHPSDSFLSPAGVFVGQRIAHDPSTGKVYIYGGSGTTRVEMVPGIVIEERPMERVEASIVIQAL